MIKPEDPRYVKDTREGMDQENQKPILETYEEFMEAAVDAALGEAMNKDKQGWDIEVEDRYNANKDLRYFNMKNYDKRIVGRTTNITDIFEAANRLDDFIKYQKDPVKKAMAMALRRAAWDYYDKYLEGNTFSTCYNALENVREKYRITTELGNQLRKKDREMIQLAQGKDEKDEEGKSLIASYRKFENMPIGEQVRLVTSFVKSFTGRNVLKDHHGNVLPPVQSEEYFMDLVNKEAQNICAAAAKGDKKKFGAKDEYENRDFADLASSFKQATKQQREGYSNAIKEFKDKDHYANMDIALDIDHLDLTLENNPIIDISVEQFIEKESKKDKKNQQGELVGLSYAEIEWGEANIDSMLRGLYTDDEYKKLRRAGIDPAMGLMVDGKPLDWFKVTEYGASYDKQDTLTRARQKCNVLAKALNGSKIDAFKFVPDGKGGLKKGKLYPVKTNLEMKTDQPPKRSIWEWIKKFFGFSVKPTIKEKIQKANEETRDYLSYFDPDKKSRGLPPEEVINLLSEAKRDELSTKLKVNIDRDARNLNVFEKEFFGDVFDKYPNDDMNDEFNFSFDNINDNEMSKEQRLQKKVKSAFSFIDYNEYDKKNEAGRAEAKKYVPDSTDIISTMGRQGSRVNMAILYGMTMGYTYDEMTDTSLNGKERRKEVGEYFIKEFATMDYDKFMQSKNLQDNDKTREAYLNYTLGKKEKLELFSLRALEAIEREPIIRPNPQDYNEVVGQITKMNGFFNMAHDFIQSIQPLTANKIAPTNTKANILTDRSSTIHDYINSKLYPVSSMAFCTKRLSNALASDTFVRTSDTVDDPYTVTWAAQSKAALIYYYDQTIDLKNYGDIMNDAKLNSYLSAVVFESRSDNFTEKQAETYLKYDLQIPLANNILIYDREGKIMKKDQKIEDFTPSINNAAAGYRNDVDKMRAYVDTDEIIKNKGSVAKTFEEAIAVGKEVIREAVTLDNLMKKDKKPEQTAKKKPAEKKTPEIKTPEMGGLGKK